jgi:hypothetical protein
LRLILNLQNNQQMKKVLAIMFIAGAMVACNSSSDKKETPKDSTTTPMVDTTTKMMDTTSHMVDTAAKMDTSKPK